MQGLLAGLEQRMSTTDLGDCTDDQLSGLVRELNRGRRKLDGYLARIATIARSREDAGGGPPVDQLFGGRGDVSRSEAERQANRGKVADGFPRAAERMHDGEALTENMDTLARLTERLSDEERQRLTVFDQEIADRAMSLAPEHFTRWLTKLIRSIRDEDRPSTAEEQKKASKLNMGRRRDGMWWLSGVLDPERGAEVNAAINDQARKLADDRTATANTRAAALHHLATKSGTNVPAKLGIGFIIDAHTFNYGHDHPHDDHNRNSAQGHSHQGHDHHDDNGDTRVAQTWAGEDYDPDAIGRLACDADHYAILINQLGHPDAVGRTRRAATLEQRLALRALYRGCPLDGTPFDYCDLHHVLAFEAGGPTTLDNLVPISKAWHHRIHDRGWRLTMHAGRSLELHRPNGQLDREIPAPKPLTRQRE